MGLEVKIAYTVLLFDVYLELKENLKHKMNEAFTALIYLHNMLSRNKLRLQKQAENEAKLSHKKPGSTDWDILLITYDNLD